MKIVLFGKGRGCTVAFFLYVVSYVVSQICHNIYATGVLEVARVGHKWYLKPDCQLLIFHETSSPPLVGLFCSSRGSWRDWWWLDWLPMFKSPVKRRLRGRRLRVLGKHLRAKGWKQAIPILRIIRWIVRICKLVWVEIRHKDQINVCRERFLNR